MDQFIRLGNWARVLRFWALVRQGAQGCVPASLPMSSFLSPSPNGNKMGPIWIRAPACRRKRDGGSGAGWVSRLAGLRPGVHQGLCWHSISHSHFQIRFFSFYQKPGWAFSSTIQSASSSRWSRQLQLSSRNGCLNLCSWTRVSIPLPISLSQTGRASRNHSLFLSPDLSRAMPLIKKNLPKYPIVPARTDWYLSLFTLLDSLSDSSRSGSNLLQLEQLHIQPQFHLLTINMVFGQPLNSVAPPVAFPSSYPNSPFAPSSPSSLIWQRAGWNSPPSFTMHFLLSFLLLWSSLCTDWPMRCSSHYQKNAGEWKSLRGDWLRRGWARSPRLQEMLLPILESFNSSISLGCRWRRRIGRRPSYSILRLDRDPIDSIRPLIRVSQILQTTTRQSAFLEREKICSKKLSMRSSTK